MRSSWGEGRGSRHRPPPWWPEGEGWPPRYQGWKPGPRPGGRGPTPNPWPHFGRWLVRLVLVTVAAGLLLPLVLGVVLATTIGGWTSVGIAALSWAAIALIVAIVLRLGLRQLRPIRSLIDTAGRLADGDYTARVANSSPPLEPVVSSFNRMAERLESAEEQRRRLLADVGHELRTPLTIVRGELEAMADGVRQLDEAQIRLLLTDLATVERLLDDLQTLSTAEAGTLRIHREPTDLVALTRQATSRLAPDHDPSGVGVTVTVESRAGDDPLEADVDPVRIREVVANLVTNAIRATEARAAGEPDPTTGAAPPQEGTVRVVVDRVVDDGRVDAVIEVIDNGVGVPADELAQVFDRFHRGAGSGESGLGLTIARNLVEAHDGQISIDSTAGQGTTVTVRLPLDPP